MVLRLNKLTESILSLHTRLLRPSTSFCPFLQVYTAPRVVSTMPEKTPFHCPEVSWRKKFTSASWRLKYVKLHHPDPLQVARQTIRSAPQRIEPTQCHQFNINKDSVEAFESFPYLEHIETSQTCSHNHCHLLCCGQKSTPVPAHRFSSTLMNLGNATLRFTMRLT
jgi:hypothetical protein